MVVKTGKIGETGNNMIKIKKKMEKRGYMVNQIKNYSSYEEVGEADTEVRLLLLDTIIKASMLCNTESWVGITQEEEKEIERNHYEILRKSFGLATWPYKYSIVGKRLVLFHQLMNSDDERVAIATYVMSSLSHVIGETTVVFL